MEATVHGRALQRINDAHTRVDRQGLQSGQAMRDGKDAEKKNVL